MRTKVTLDTKTILYLLEIEVEGVLVQKIGITSRKIEDRCLEILESYFKGHREFPYMRPKRYRKVVDAYEKEQKLLKMFEEYKYVPEKPFGGHTELIKVDLDILVQEYEKMIEEDEMILDTDDKWEKCPKCGKAKKFSVVVDGKEKKVCGSGCETKD